MVGKTDKTPQLNVFKIPLNLYINHDHELCLLSKKIEGLVYKVEEEFREYYCANNGRPSFRSKNSWSNFT